MLPDGAVVEQRDPLTATSRGIWKAYDDVEPDTDCASSIETGTHARPPSRTQAWLPVPSDTEDSDDAARKIQMKVEEEADQPDVPSLLCGPACKRICLTTSLIAVITLFLFVSIIYQEAIANANPFFKPTRTSVEPLPSVNGERVRYGDSLMVTSLQNPRIDGKRTIRYVSGLPGLPLDPSFPVDIRTRTAPTRLAAANPRFHNYLVEYGRRRYPHKYDRTSEADPLSTKEPKVRPVQSRFPSVSS